MLNVELVRVKVKIIQSEVVMIPNKVREVMK